MTVTMHASDDILDIELTEALRERGQRVTLPRLMVHRYVRRAPRHVTADDVRHELPSLSFGTVYSTLELFEELGLVQRVGTLEGAAVYDSRTEPHHHALCRRCGRLVDFDATRVSERVRQAAADTGFRVERAEVQVVGLCADCAARA
jgi:Fe2+ or Zn2+ uptake regulation protein